jgi:saccharopine dehydrogenase-like NADP-dependent oxidoreductase
MKVFSHTGLFDDKEIDVNGVKVKPLDVTAKLLIPRWTLKKGEKDLTVMRITVEGEKNGEKLRYTYDLFDKYDEKEDITSMARTTGYSATMGVRLLAKGLYKQVGISPPEYVGRDQKCVDFTL